MIYYRNDVRKSGVNARKLKATLQRLLAAVGEEESSISLSLIDDEAIKELNRLHRGKNKATDVLSFPQREGHATPLCHPERSGEAAESRDRRNASCRSFDSAHDKSGRPRNSAANLAARSAPNRAEESLGDIVISVETARRQAAEYDVPLERELERLMIHGLLHLLGHDHERAGERRTMVAQERRLAACIGMPWPYDA